MALCTPLTRSARRDRETQSSPPWLTSTPADSGYGSVTASPEHDIFCSHLDLPPRYGLSSLLDGNTSSELGHPFDGSDDHDSSPFVLRGAAERRPLRSATMPRLPVCTRPALPKSFFSECGSSNSGGSSEGGLWGRHSNSLRRPDRFVPFRCPSRQPRDVFRTSKSPDQLSAAEKLTRNDMVTPDAFCFRRRRFTSMAANPRYQTRSESGIPRIGVGSVLGLLSQNNADINSRQANALSSQVSSGAIWAVGGVAPAGPPVNTGRGQLVQSGTNVRLFRTSFAAARSNMEEEQDKHEDRLACALALDRVQRVLKLNVLSSSPQATYDGRSASFLCGKTVWDGSKWVNSAPPNSVSFLAQFFGCELKCIEQAKPWEGRILPAAPFKILDAPGLRDDFYCSLLAFCSNNNTLVVGLGNLLYCWAEKTGVKLLNAGEFDHAWLTSLAFSSAQGCKGILAFGRSNGKLALMSMYDSEDSEHEPGPMPRFDVQLPSPVSCLSWKPTYAIRPSRCPFNSHPRTLVKVEDLLVGDELGHVRYYSVEWPERWELNRNTWPGEMVLVCIIKLHTQQICGISWSSNGDLFASGGNDNLCLLFETSKITDRWERARRNLCRLQQRASDEDGGLGSHEEPPNPTVLPRPVELKAGDERYKWLHGAAVKAIAFCPWQDGLVATGGGSNDKCIHFFHTTTGLALATIAVSAQVTSLIWSTTRREIVATFGYAQPDHPYRIAVFSWPDCRQIAAIPWEGEHRALHAIPYPKRPGSVHHGPDELRSGKHLQTATEGCIVVAASDKSVKFHEVWSRDRRSTVSGTSMLGGSDILESLEGIDKEGEVIR